jgi:hypothetical protein
MNHDCHQELGLEGHAEDPVMILDCRPGLVKDPLERVCRFPIRKGFRFFANSASPAPLQRRRTDMARAYSQDLRDRVIDAAFSGTSARRAQGR